MQQAAQMVATRAAPETRIRGGGSGFHTMAATVMAGEGLQDRVNSGIVCRRTGGGGGGW